MAMVEPKTTQPELMGWLYKWTNYLKGYQKRWFVLSNGLLSYYRNQLEMRHTCRGSVSLHNAIISTTDPCSFIISNGGNQTFHIRAGSEKERQTWLTALTLAKSCKYTESEEEEEFTDSAEVSAKVELNDTLKQLASKLDDLQICNDVIPKHWAALNRSLTELETLSSDSSSINVREFQERATLFRITSNAMVNKCAEFNDFAQSQGKKWQRMLQHERDQRLRLEEMVEQLARQHSNLEQAAKQHQTPRSSANQTVSDEDDDHEFYDATSYQDDEFSLNLPSYHHRRTESGISQASQGEASGSSSEAEEAVQNSEKIQSKVKQIQSTSHSSQQQSSQMQVVQSGGGRVRRTRVPDKPHYPLSLWSIMKNCIGKELSKIPMPVNFSEPLSMLQRLTEDYEYAYILDKAAACTDSCEQLAYVAAFTVSSYSTTAVRTGKPFNPLLGETYECDRMDDLGWRSVSEQVSHHPPMFAQYCEGQQWKSWQEFTMASKFRGKYLQVIPLGISHLTFNGTENHYTWRKVRTTVHNIIVGKLWVDQDGDMDIKNHHNGDVCHLKYIAYGYFTKGSQRKVKGWVRNKEGEVKWVIAGAWDSKIEIAPVISTSGTPDNPTYKTGAYVVAWEANPPNPGCDKFYNLSVLASQLNEPEPGVAPTDSRLRPDQRLMEEGQWDEANEQKIRLEEKQRAVRKLREMAAEEAAARGEEVAPHQPIWFTKERDPVTGGLLHVYSGDYWDCKTKQDWSRCPDIF